MAFKTAAELVVFSTGTFIDNTTGDISPLDFRNMHQHLTDSMIPYDASGVYGVKVLPTGNVPTPTPTGFLVYDGGVQVFNGTAWSGIGGGGGGDGDTTYTAGSGLQLVGTVFNALTASTSVTGVTVLTNTIDASQNKALTPKAVNDAGYLSTPYTAGTGLALTGTKFYTAGTGDFDVLDLLPSTGVPFKEGRIYYDDTSKALICYNEESEITQQLGQEEWVRVRNNSGATIPNGKAVRIVGSQGTNLTIDLACSSSLAKAAVLGLATHDIENNSFGYVTTAGIVNDVDTSSLGEGSGVYLSTTNSGELVANTAGPPNYKIEVGHVVRTHASAGKIFVRPLGVRFGGGQVSNTGVLVSGVPFVSHKSGNDASISTDTTFVYSSGSSELSVPNIIVSNTGNFQNGVTVASGVELSSATPSVTTNKLYNIGGTLYFNGSEVGGGGGGGGSYDWIFGDGNGNTETIASGETVYASGTGSVTATYSTSTNILTINGTDTTYTAGSGLELDGTTFNSTVVDTDTTYTAGTGLALNGTEFSTAQTGYFDAVVVSDSGNIGGVFTTNKAVKTAIKSNADGATITFDLNESNTHYATLGGNRTIALSNPAVGQKFILRLQQDTTGGRTVTWFTTIKWDGATPPTLSTSGNRADLFGFLCTSGNQYDGMVLAQNLG